MKCAKCGGNKICKPWYDDSGILVCYECGYVGLISLEEDADTETE